MAHKKQEGEPIKTAICRLLEMPEYSFFAESRIEISANREAVVENCRSILEYTPEIIRLLTPKMTIRFIGKELCIKNMNGSGAMVTGFIESIELSALE